MEGVIMKNQAKKWMKVNAKLLKYCNLKNELPKNSVPMSQLK